MLGLVLPCCTAQFDPCFTPVQHVKDLRVLGVRADPPEVLFDPAGDLPPPVLLRALVIDPGQTDDLAVSGVLCAPTDDHLCPPGSMAIQPGVGRPGDIGLVAQASRELLDAARDADPLKGFGGIRLQLELRVRASFGRKASASKLLVYSPQAPGYVPNHGLEIDALAVTRSGEPSGFVTQSGGLSLLVGTYVGLTPLLSPGRGGSQAQEEYDVVDLSGRRVHLVEHVSYSFFSTLHARFKADTVEEPPASATPAADGLAQFRATFQSSGKLYVVARDGRGAEAWLYSDWDAVDQRVDEMKVSYEIECSQ